MMKMNSETPCDVCETLIDTEIHAEELGMCIDCSNDYFSQEQLELPPKGARLRIRQKSNRHALKKITIYPPNRYNYFALEGGQMSVGNGKINLSTKVGK